MRARQRGAMRSVFWLLGLAALAVALAMLVGDNRSTVTLFWPPWRFDVSFNFVLFVLVGGFVLVYAALRGLALLRELPLQARRWRSQQMERAVVGWVLDALANQIAGRFVRAQSAAQNALEHLQGSTSSDWPRRDELRALAHLLAAESAHSLQNRARRDEHLQEALNPALTRNYPELMEGALLRATRWAVEDRDLAAARTRLADLPQGAQRRIQALRLKLRVARLGEASGEALETARLLAKHGAWVWRSMPCVARTTSRSCSASGMGWTPANAPSPSWPWPRPSGRRAWRAPSSPPAMTAMRPRAPATPSACAAGSNRCGTTSAHSTSTTRPCWPSPSSPNCRSSTPPAWRAWSCCNASGRRTRTCSTWPARPACTGSSGARPDSCWAWRAAVCAIPPSAGAPGARSRLAEERGDSEAALAAWQQAAAID